ncbi:hypothetical protein, partial [Treponema sp. R80B11-R83G3]
RQRNPQEESNTVALWRRNFIVPPPCRRATPPILIRKLLRLPPVHMAKDPKKTKMPDLDKIIKRKSINR